MDASGDGLYGIFEREGGKGHESVDEREGGKGHRAVNESNENEQWFVHVRWFKLAEQINEYKRIFLYMFIRLKNYIVLVCSFMFMNILNERRSINITNIY